MVLGRQIIEMKIYCLGIFARAPPRGFPGHGSEPGGSFPTRGHQDIRGIPIFPLGSVYCILIILDDFSLRFSDFDKYAVTKR